MYTIRYQCGYDLFSIGGRDFGRVCDSTGAIRYEGTYDGAVAWLESRGVRRADNR